WLAAGDRDAGLQHPVGRQDRQARVVDVREQGEGEPRWVVGAPGHLLRVRERRLVAVMAVGDQDRDVPQGGLDIAVDFGVGDDPEPVMRTLRTREADCGGTGSYLFEQIRDAGRIAFAYKPER